MDYSKVTDQITLLFINVKQPLCSYKDKFAHMLISNLGGSLYLLLGWWNVDYFTSLVVPDVDMLENVEIGEQKRRNEAYKASKKGTGTYDDK